jgi:hypothetical protein
MAAAGALKPGEHVAIASGITGILRLVQEFEVSSTQVQYFNPFHRPPPADVTVVDAAWPARQPARASWPDAPPGWRIVAANRFGRWVVWRRLRPGRAPAMPTRHAPGSPGTPRAVPGMLRAVPARPGQSPARPGQSPRLDNTPPGIPGGQRRFHKA